MNENFTVAFEDIRNQNKITNPVWQEKVYFRTRKMALAYARNCLSNDWPVAVIGRIRVKAGNEDIVKINKNGIIK